MAPTLSNPCSGPAVVGRGLASWLSLKPLILKLGCTSGHHWGTPVLVHLPWSPQDGQPKPQPRACLTQPRATEPDPRTCLGASRCLCGVAWEAFAATLTKLPVIREGRVCDKQYKLLFTCGLGQRWGHIHSLPRGGGGRHTQPRAVSSPSPTLARRKHS